MLLQLDDIYKDYIQGKMRVPALKDICLHVNEGEYVAIMGPSGSGKSTLMHILGGVDVPTSGTVNISGTDISGLDETKLAIFRRRHIGLIYQFYNLIPILNVEENMTLPILLDKKKPDGKLLLELVEKLGLSDRLKHLPNQLSGGQQQRVSIGRALMNHPSLLLADEPTGNLDSKNSKEIIALLRKFNKEYNQTVIIITHDERIALSADRVITIEDGQITRDTKDTMDRPVSFDIDEEVSV
jgi:putative ABC transport system ATP-binding protein